MKTAKEQAELILDNCSNLESLALETVNEKLFQTELTTEERIYWESVKNEIKEISSEFIW